MNLIYELDECIARAELTLTHKREIVGDQWVTIAYSVASLHDELLEDAGLDEDPEAEPLLSDEYGDALAEMEVQYPAVCAFLRNPGKRDVLFWLCHGQHHEFLEYLSPEEQGKLSSPADIRSYYEQHIGGDWQPTDEDRRAAWQKELEAEETKRLVEERIHGAEAVITEKPDSDPFGDVDFDLIDLDEYPD